MREELAMEREKAKAKAKGGEEAAAMSAAQAIGQGSPGVLVSCRVCGGVARGGGAGLGATDDTRHDATR